MRILLKCPTRSRPQKAISTLKKYVDMANRKDLLGILVSCDADDTSMQNVRNELTATLRPASWSKVVYGNSKSKIQACNADIAECDWEWDIVVLVSDDMQPQVQGYDDAVRSYMMASFPNTDGILWFNDGFQGTKLNTLTIFGKAMYNSFGYLYHPEYVSLYCDTELTDLCRTTLKDKTVYIPTCIIRHEHPATGYGGNDALYAHNSKVWNRDMHTYIRRKNYAYDLTILIPTVPGRESRLQTLIQSIHARSAGLRVEIKIDFDNREVSIGAKRQRLLQGAQGKYCVFVDDDDAITDAYFEDVRATIAGGFDVMRLRGQIEHRTFTHSLSNTLDMPMVVGEEFLRPPNHLNPVLSDIAKNVPFKDAKRGEDLDWSITLSKMKLLSTEYQSDKSRIHYIYNVRAPIADNTVDYQRNNTYEAFLKSVWLDPTAPQQSNGRLRLGPKGFVSR